MIRGFELANSCEDVGEVSRQFLQELVQKGWLVISWPKEFGGQEKSNTLLFILMNELSYFEMSPSDFAAGIGSSFIFGPLLMRYGTNQVKRELLPSVAKCEVGFCLGWSEPDSGSDLASVKTRAEDKGDYYLVNGQKTFGTATHFATHQVFLARTNIDVPKHRGLSVMMTELKSPGVTVRPLWTMGNHRLSEVYFDNVKVPKKYLLGKENEGWKFTVEELDLERMLEPGNIKRILDELVGYVKETTRNGELLAGDPLIRQELAELAIEFAIANSLFMRIAWMLDQGKIPSNEISMEKVFVSELWYRAADLGTRILGLEGILEEDSKWARLNGLITRQYQRSIGRTIYMGTSEIQRNIVATRWLGLPR
ncbi:MAG: acyl-CoA dehydrogenase family protein [Chloroflexota bacterium]|nr:acyl-CoA dehydrogenase family protein [Chloroflexota bacterium]